MDNTARLNITWNGNNGDLVDPIPLDLTEDSIRNVAQEAVRGGSVPGVPADPGVDFSDFVVERFAATDTLPARVMIRPKVPFGA